MIFELSGGAHHAQAQVLDDQKATGSVAGALAPPTGLLHAAEQAASSDRICGASDSTMGTKKAAARACGLPPARMRALVHDVQQVLLDLLQGGLVDGRNMIYAFDLQAPHGLGQLSHEAPYTPAGT
ncbi:hypothetical protein QRO08_06230 [Paracidovorax citrulli]|uniref:Uncharacterized protein n=1 Tax=Paracidovorax citrulli TaxID=80869 RepID=A0ABY9ATN9_PARCI|nr:hypothetical protein [Paracidovorax citrulli]WIY30613.1 hypothetical protein QRO09_02460 [Paracidovorax citrulli]WIY39832.1 hypothetical protein QRO10_02445 [Paracidovorax citrulli]WIY42942.1 hypothetical protein QRO12_18640 [Paracidovorax citrulli]WIY50169.1 hypothetical protein QRO08_06230 [Paracidovorax citrulli]